MTSAGSVLRHAALCEQATGTAESRAIGKAAWQRLLPIFTWKQSHVQLAKRAKDDA